ncbi:MAG: hypothetical protein AB1638_06655 [Nitrospirota bacterium]
MKMGAKEEFEKLMGEIGDLILKEGAKSRRHKFTNTIIEKNIFRMLMNLDRQIEELREYLKKLETEAKRSENKFKLLIKELERLGYINIRERRSLLKRNILTQEALFNLLKRRGIVSKKDLLDEIKKPKLREGKKV